MTTRTRLVRILAVVFAFGLVAAACGDDDEGGDVSGNDLGGRTVTVGVENAYLPFNYVPAGETEGQGWDYDAWREICRIINCEADFVVAGLRGVAGSELRQEDFGFGNVTAVKGAFAGAAAAGQ